ncbi:hypothetical protein Hdeb2414_s0297g00860181 [Helianthus debilis subsp. tardiflorus]
MSTMYPFPSHVSVQSFVTVKLCDKGMYDLWKTQMLYLLKSHHMLGLLKNRGSVDDDLKRSDALVSGWILASLSEQAAIMVLSRLKSKFPQQTDFTAKETWDEVQIMYGQHEADAVKRLTDVRMTKSEVYEGFSHVFCDESTQNKLTPIFWLPEKVYLLGESRNWLWRR